MLRPLFLIATASSLLFGARAAVHTHLVKAEPGVDSNVTVAPTQIRLWFNEAPEVALSAATLLKSDNSPVATVKMAATDDTLSVAGAVPVALEPGSYQVLWRTGSKDGHAVRGKYKFSYDPAAAPRP
jgi:methionine-rich copper-binding protein CopC